MAFFLFCFVLSCVVVFSFFLRTEYCETANRREVGCWSCYLQQWKTGLHNNRPVIVLFTAECFCAWTSVCATLKTYLLCKWAFNSEIRTG